MPGWGVGPVKTVGKQRGGEGTQREGTQRRSGMSHQLSKVREHILNEAEVSERKGFGEKKEEMLILKLEDGWTCEAREFSWSVWPGLAKPLWPAVWLQARIRNSGEQLAKHAGWLWWRELRRCVKYIGQDKARGRIAQWITQACLERDWRLLKGWVERGGWQLYTAGCCSAVEWDCM